MAWKSPTPPRSRQVAAVATNFMQVGFLFVPTRISVDIERINPLKGLRRLFSPATAMRLGFGLFKVVVIAVVAFVSLYDRWAEIIAASQLEPGAIALLISGITLWTCLKIGVALLLLALLDYAFQRWKHEQDLRMTQQEIRQEFELAVHGMDFSEPNGEEFRTLLFTYFTAGAMWAQAVLAPDAIQQINKGEKH